MCGIIGIFGNNDSKKRAHQALEKIIHRGSNVFEVEFFENGALGANRLAIVDRENGRQPKYNEDKSMFVVQNGEIFNYKELKKELQSKGHKFQSDSDTEVLVHLYEEYGPEMVKKIDSEMFAFVIYDRENNNIYAARDPLGVKPLYYAHDKSGQLYFASELKQLSFFKDIEKIYNFPPGSFFYNGKIKKYFKLRTSNNLTNENKIINLLEKNIVEAVAKRVDTDLPIGVFLSGGVDSSLIMEIATRLHPDVTAIILGYPGSPDYEYALRLCADRHYKYHIVRPDVDYEKELDNLIYHAETYEPNVIRHTFSINICAKEAQRLGLKIILVGEASDELFCGYNEFSNLSENSINNGSFMLVDNLNVGQLQRVDRMTMRHTIEVRVPFLDKSIVETAMRISGNLKIKRDNHQITTKYILRKVAANFLPDYIAWRYKVPFSNGAGMNVGNNYKSQDGDVAKAVLNKPEGNIPENIKRKYPITTREESYYLSKFHSYGFTKLIGSEKRLIVKEKINELNKSKKVRFLVGEFGRLAIYFPAYFAAEKGIFNLHNLDVDFIATGGDDKTYSSLVNNSAHIGLSDPMFAMFENKEGVKGEIIGELVSSSPSVAVTINPRVKINSLKDFAKYKVGTFQKYSTTHTTIKHILPKETEIIPLEFNQLISKLIDRSVDIAVILPEQAYNLTLLGGRIVFDFKTVFPKMLYSGFTIANILEPKYRRHLKSFIVAVREAIRYIYKNKEEALKLFIKIFPEIKQPEIVFNSYLSLWSNIVRVDKEEYRQAYNIWKSEYPELLKNYTPFFKTPSRADPIIEIINSREYRKDFPFLEDILEKIIIDSIDNGKLLKLIGFWGAGDKESINAEDNNFLERFSEYIQNIKKVSGLEIEITWILANEHAIANGYAKEKVKKYLSDVNNLIIAKGFKTIHLSGLWKKWGINYRLIDSSIKQKKPGWWNEVNIAKQLEDQAEKRFKYDDKKVGAKKYYIMRALEKKYIEKDFKEHVFFTFSDGQMQSIYPKMPTIYLHAQKRGNGEVPWFID